MKSGLKDIVCIISGAFFLALALNIFLEPNSIVTGGATGLGIIIAFFTQKIWGYSLPLWLSNLVINILLLYPAYKVQGIKLLEKTVYGTLLLSFFLWITNNVPAMDGELFLSGIFGGVLSGIGVGLIFKGGGTTGGSDLLSAVIHGKYPYINISAALFFIDLTIIVLGLFVFGAVPAMYAIIAAYITSKVTDRILSGVNYAKVAFIFSDKREIMGEAIMARLNRGVTMLKGKGMYTGNSRDPLMVVVSAKQISQLKDITRETDKNAFIFIVDVREVRGDF